MRRVLASLLLLAGCSAPRIDDQLSTDGVKMGGDDIPPPRDAGSTPTPAEGGTKAQNFQLTVNLTGSGTGTVSSSPAGVTCNGNACTGSFAKGTAVTLTLTPAPGSIFVAWSGGCSGTSTCAPVLDKDVTVGAELTSLDGAWSGTYTNTRQAFGCTFNNAGNLTITATMNGTTLSHSGNVTGLELRSIPSCNLVGTTTGSAPASNITVAGDTLTGTWTFNVQGAGGTLAFPFTAKVSGKSMTGSWTCQTCTGSFTLTKP
jgi:hypothetical protein